MKSTQGALILAAIIGTGLPALAQDQESEDTSMRGLPGIYVFVDKIPASLNSGGALDVELESQVEVRLKRAGIKILERPEALAHAGKPFLFIQVRGAKVSDQPVYSLVVIGGLVQRVALERDPSLTCFARTWMISSFNSPREQELKAQIFASVAQVADEFAKSYRQANPKH